MHSLWFDGGAQPNPGKAAGAFVLKQNGVTVAKGATFLAHATNNAAEYTGLIEGLKAVRLHGISEVEIFGDSQLVVFQVQGRYKCKVANLRILLEKVKELTEGINWSISHVQRNENAEADALADECIENN